MARQFNIPTFYRSSIISLIKAARRQGDQRKRDYSPSILDLGPVRYKIARHFGFCFGVENAIEIAYRALDENPGKRVFLLSEMIHNPQVNGDLRARGIQFLLTPSGEQLIPFEALTSEDIVIVPAFGTTVELFEKLRSIGINPTQYNATCPFVEKVWKRADQLGERGYSVVIHGKHAHEETRATFSHSRLAAPSIVIRDISEAARLAKHLRGEGTSAGFFEEFRGRFSEGFDPEVHLTRIGVVNQTTMLATETQAISDLLRDAMRERWGEQALGEHFADTRDTLCYATSENQEAVLALVQGRADLAIVVGGYNSSNTSHLVELCAERYPTYYIKDAGEIVDELEIRHLKLHSTHGGERVGITKKPGEAQGILVTSSGWLPRAGRPVEILITAGASCPDALVDEVIQRITSLFPEARPIEEALAPFRQASEAVSSL